MIVILAVKWSLLKHSKQIFETKKILSRKKYGAKFLVQSRSRHVLFGGLKSYEGTADHLHTTSNCYLTKGIGQGKNGFGTWKDI